MTPRARNRPSNRLGSRDAAGLDGIKRWIRSHLSPRRVRHTEGVVRTAVQLAKRHGVAPGKARLAAWLHDAAKEMPYRTMERHMKTAPLPWTLMERRLPALRHPKAAAALASGKWGIRDRDVLKAVALHAMGAPRMGKLEMVLFVADFIEPGRNLPGLPAIRRSAFLDLKGGARLKAERTLAYLRRIRARIHPGLAATYSWLMRSHRPDTKAPGKLILIGKKRTRYNSAKDIWNE